MESSEMREQGPDILDPEAPAFFDTYGSLFAFTLLWSLVGIAAFTMLPPHAETLSYVALVGWAPLAAMATLLLTERRPGTMLGLAGRAVLLTAVAAFATVFGITLLVPMFALAQARYLLAPRSLAGVLVGVVALTVLIVVPLSISFVRAARARAQVGARLRAGAILAALAVIAVVAYTTLVPGHPLAALVSKEQASALLGAVSWYLPAYALTASLARRFGFG
jgi:hypothetical protein